MKGREREMYNDLQTKSRVIEDRDGLHGWQLALEQEGKKALKTCVQKVEYQKMDVAVWQAAVGEKE